MRICSIDGCGLKHKSKGLCQKHYQRTSECVAYKRAYNQTPERIAANKARGQTPEFKSYNKPYKQSLKGIAAAIAYSQTPERKAAKKAYNRTPEAKAKKNARQKVRRAIDELFCYSQSIRNLINISFYNGGFSKTSKTCKILGCSLEEAMALIGWFPGCHIHHIVYLKTANTKEDIERLNHHTNLIALTHKEHKALHAGRFELIPRKEKI